MIPHEQPPEWKPESSHMYKYLVTAHSSVVFLTHNYCIVYCLDMSPSLSVVVSHVRDLRFCDDCFVGCATMYRQVSFYTTVVYWKNMVQIKHKISVKNIVFPGS